MVKTTTKFGLSIAAVAALVLWNPANAPKSLAQRVLPSEIAGGEATIETSQYKRGRVDLEIPTPSLYRLRPFNCSLYARKVTEAMGNEINPGHAWDLHKVNKSKPYDPKNLIPGDLVTFMNPESRYATKGREETHVATFLGMDPKTGEQMYAEQRGWDTRVSSLQDLINAGNHPIRTIIPKNRNYSPGEISSR